MTNPIDNLYHYKATVASIYDGDTVRLNIDVGFYTCLMKVSCRLYGIDTPEIRGEERPKGLQAKQFLLSLIPPGTEILIKSHIANHDKYGRWLVTIYDTSNRNINKLLVENGYAEEVDW